MKRTSDQGWTSLRGGGRARKDHPLLTLGGDLDELNSLLGAASAALAGPAFVKVREPLAQAQAALLSAGCALAGPRRGPAALADATAALELSLAVLFDDLPVLRGFVIPGGSPAGAWLHVARAVCRRVERGAAALSRREPLPEGLAAFLNRLSKWLFTAARWVNARQGRPEAPWPGPLAAASKRR